jgi:hypothetical protein
MPAGGTTRIVGHGVQEGDPPLLDAAVDDLEARHQGGGGEQYVRRGDSRPLERAGKDERDLHLHPRLDETGPSDPSPVGQDHVVEQDPVVRLVHAKQTLDHRVRRADLSAHLRRALPQPDRRVGLLNRVGVGQGHGGVQAGQGWSGNPVDLGTAK